MQVLRYATMINGVNWYVVTKMDVLDELAEIPVCVGYKYKGKKINEIPADARAYEKVECLYEKLPGWRKSTEGIREFSKLPAKAQDYLKFIEEHSGAKIGMISTGADRDHTIFVPEFADQFLAKRKTAMRKLS
jgi:adenylosuccinate synthase